MSKNIDARTALLDQYQKAFETGDPKALFDAIASCAIHHTPLPAWVADAFIAGYVKVDSYKVDSWDAAFGKPYRMNAKHVTAQRKQLNSQWPVYEAVRAAHAEGASINTALFTKIGKKFAISGSTVRDYYYRVHHAVTMR